MNVYMGWDPREQVAYDVAEMSILKNAKAGVNVIPLKLSELEQSGLLTRPVERREHQLWCPISEAPMATEFAISRFCVPFIQQTGWAVFMDCDVLCFDNVLELLTLADKKYAVQVVKHHHTSGETVKMDNQIQTFYERKNWSSVILWNCEHPAHQRLTLTELNSWPGRDLHAFRWLQDDEIGELPRGWNYLVGVSPVIPALMLHLAHFTLGTPNMRAYDQSPYAEQWWKEYGSLVSVAH